MNLSIAHDKGTLSSLRPMSDLIKPGLAASVLLMISSWLEISPVYCPSPCSGHNSRWLSLSMG